MTNFAGTVVQDVRYAVRMLRKSPGFTAVAVLSLALGIGANTAIFSITDALLLKQLPVRAPQELFQVTTPNGVFTNPIWEQIRDRQDVFSGAFAWSAPLINVSRTAEKRYVNGLLAGGDFFSTLGVHALAGRTFTVSDDRRGCDAMAVLGYGFWQREYGGSQAAIGQTVTIDDRPFPIIGITPPEFFGVEVGRTFDVAIPLCAKALLRNGAATLDARSTWWLNVMGRLKPGISPSQAEARLKILAPEIYSAVVPPKWTAEMQKEFRSGTLGLQPAGTGASDLRKRYRGAVIFLSAIVALVLLIACANVANLMLARAGARQKEIAVRVAIGASRWRLVRQLLTESLILSAAGAALGILFAIWGAATVLQVISSTTRPVTLSVGLDLRLLAYTAAAAVITALLFGLAPAFRGTRVAPVTALKQGSRNATADRTRFGLGRTLVVAQVTISLLLMIGAGLFVGSFHKLVTLDPGFAREGVLIVDAGLRNTRYPKDRRLPVFDDMLHRVRQIPGVRSASASMLTPIAGSSWNDWLFIDGYASKSKLDTLTYFNRVSPHYFATLGTPLLAGRDFDEHDTLTAPKVAIINETVARKFFAGRSPVGATFRTEGDPGKLGDPVTIVGVVKDTKYRSLREELLPIAYLPVDQDQQPGTATTFEVRASGDLAAVVPQVRQALTAAEKDLSLQFTTFSAQVNDSLIQERMLALLSGFFGLLAVLLATMGLYGVMWYMVTRRRSEIGIRMALGAQRWSVVWLVMREVAVLAGAGLVVGGVSAWLTTRLVASMLYGLKPNDPATLLFAAGVLIAVAGLAGYVPARRAASLDPMTALREE